MELGILLKAYLVLFGGGFCFIAALSQLLGQRKYPGKGLFVLCLLSLAIWETLGGFNKFCQYAIFPFNIYIIIFPSFGVSISTFYLLCRRILDANPVLRRRDAIHATMPLFSFLLLLPGIGRPVDLHTLMSTKTFQAMFLGFIIISLWYFCILCIKSIRLLGSTEKKNRKQLLTTSIFIIVNFLLFIVWLIDLIFFLGGVDYIIIAFNIILILIILDSTRYPDYFLQINKQANQTKYMRSLLVGVDTGKVLERVYALMVNEKLYHDPELSLESFAKRANLSPHQLSELLNSKLTKTFLEFVNDYRVKEATRLVLEGTDRKMIDIAFEVGFNSSSTFYSSFKKHTGMTPTTYRDNYVAQNSIAGIE